MYILGCASLVNQTQFRPTSDFSSHSGSYTRLRLCYYADNYQQLLNAFYPINRAKPSDVIVAYFTNYTDPLPEECSLGTYPWRTYLVTRGITTKLHTKHQSRTTLGIISLKYTHIINKASISSYY